MLTRDKFDLDVKLQCGCTPSDHAETIQETLLLSALVILEDTSITAERIQQWETEVPDNETIDWYIDKHLSCSIDAGLDSSMKAALIYKRVGKMSDKDKYKFLRNFSQKEEQSDEITQTEINIE